MIAGNGKVILKLDAEPEQTAGGIYIPEQDRKESQLGTVVTVCSAWQTDANAFRYPPVQLIVGSRVAIGRFSGIDLEVRPGEKYVVVKVDDILAILDPVEVSSGQPV